VPLFGDIYLVVVENSEIEKRDVMLLVLPTKDALTPECIENMEKTLLFPCCLPSSDRFEDIIIEVESGLFEKVTKWCAQLGVSLEQLVLAFIRFCGCTDNHTALKEWFSPINILTELASTIDELECVRAELIEIKQRFGLDKQEAFLKAKANISLKEFATMLHGRDCQPNLTPEELLLAKKRGFVVVYGDSDDRVEFEGAIREEGHTNPLTKDSPAGVLVLSEHGKLLLDDSEMYAEYIKENRNVITVYYCCRDNLNWVFETDIPHETFLTYDGGYDERYADIDDGFARCMVFELCSLSAHQDNGSPQRKFWTT